MNPKNVRPLFLCVQPKNIKTFFKGTAISLQPDGVNL